jgi:hypothetical protein
MFTLALVGHRDARVAVAAGPCTGGAIYKNVSGIWSNVPGAASFLDAEINTNLVIESVFALGNTPTSGGCLIYFYNGSTWTNVPGGAVNLAADTIGFVTAVQDSGLIYKWNGSAWTNIPGLAHQVTDGASSTGSGLYALGATLSGNNYPIYRYVGGSSVWQSIPGLASQIASAPDDTLWAVQTNGSIYHYAIGAWQSIPGLAKQVSVGSDGTVYALGFTPVIGGFQIYKYVGGGAVWQAIPGAAFGIAGGVLNDLWAHQ